VDLDPDPGVPKTCGSGSGTLPGTETSGNIRTLAGRKIEEEYRRSKKR
jgi:hypothetical protein